jgi:hypothetical protein
MHSFKDNKGRCWDIELTIGAAKRVLELLKIDLLQPETGDPPLLQRIGSDEILLVDTVFVLIKPQADIQAIKDEDFGAALDGRAALDMQKAFYDELIDFFRSRGRTDRETAAVKQKEILEKVIALGTEELERFNPDEELRKIFGKQSTNSPV